MVSTNGSAPPITPESQKAWAQRLLRGGDLWDGCAGYGRTKDEFSDPYQQQSGSAAKSIITVSDGREFDRWLDHMGKVGAPEGEAFHADGSVNKNWRATFTDVSFAVARLGGRPFISRPFSENWVVYACLRAWENAVASLRIGQFTMREGDTEAEMTPLAAGVGGEAAQLMRLFERPHPNCSMTTLMKRTVVDYKLDGEVFWFLVDDAMQPIEPDSNGFIPVPSHIIPMRGRVVRHEIDDFGMVKEWIFTTPLGNERKFSVESVIHFNAYNPDNPARGSGDITSAWRYLTLQYDIERYLDATLRHGGSPGGTITSSRKLTPEQRVMKQKEVDQKMSIENSGRVLVMGKEDKFDEFRHGTKDLEYPTSLRWIRDVVCAVTGTPPPVIGVLDRATWNNIVEARRQFWTGGNGVLTWTSFIEQTLQEDLYGRLQDARLREVHAFFNTSEIEDLKDDNVDKLKTAPLMLKQGFTPNETLNALGVELELPDDFGDKRFIDSSVIPIELSGTLSAGTDGKPDTGRTPLTPPAERIEVDDDDELEDENVEWEEYLPCDGDDESKEAYGYDYIERVLKSGDARIKKPSLAWLRRFEMQQSRRLKRFADKGKSSPGIAAAAKIAGNDLVAKKPADELTEADLKALSLPENQWAKKLVGEIKDPWERSFRLALLDAAKELGVPAVEMTDPAVRKFVKASTLQMAGDVTGTLALNVRETLVRALAKAHVTPGTLQEQIRELLEKDPNPLKDLFGGRDARAARIARTESAAASNGARFIQHEETEAVRETEWITSRDDSVRDGKGGKPNHRKLHKRRRKLGESFESGITLRYPGDRKAPVGWIVNERCVAAPVRRRRRN